MRIGRELRYPVLVWVTTRAWLWLVAYLGWTVKPVVEIPGLSWLDMWLRWDSRFYLEIAMGGYKPDAPQSAFFPLFPMLTWFFHWPARLLFSDEQSFYLAGLTLTQFLSLASVVGLYIWCRTQAGEATGRRACWLYCLAPGSFFACAFYTEALFFAVTTWSYVLSSRGWQVSANLLSGLSALVRPQGMFFAGAMFLDSVVRRRKWLSSLLCLLPFTLFLLGQWYALGTPFAFLQAQQKWGGTIETRGQLYGITFFGDIFSDWAITTANFLSILLVIVCLPLCRWWLGYAPALFLAAGGCIGGFRFLHSAMRFVCHLPPLFYVLGRVLSHPLVLILWLIASAILQAYFTYGFTSGAWIC